MTRDVGWDRAARHYLDRLRGAAGGAGQPVTLRHEPKSPAGAPPQGAPVPEDFRLDEAAVPQLAPGEVLVRTIWLSLDPYMRGRMNERPPTRRRSGSAR